MEGYSTPYALRNGSSKQFRHGIGATVRSGSSSMLRWICRLPVAPPITHWSAAGWAAVLVVAPPTRSMSVLKAKTNRKRSEEHTSELQSLAYLVCRLLLEKKKNRSIIRYKDTRITGAHEI